MLTSCFSCNRASTSSEVNPNMTAGLARMNDLREAVNELAATTKACVKLAFALEGDLRKASIDLDLVDNLHGAQSSLALISDYCKSTTFELKCFSKHFAKAYPKAGSKAGLIDREAAHFDNEVRRRGEFTQQLATETFPLAHSAERALSQAANALLQRPPLGLVHAVENLERTSALHR